MTRLGQAQDQNETRNTSDDEVNLVAKLWHLLDKGFDLEEIVKIPSNKVLLSELQGHPLHKLQGMMLTLNVIVICLIRKEFYGHSPDEPKNHAGIEVSRSAAAAGDLSVK